MTQSLMSVLATHARQIAASCGRTPVLAAAPAAALDWLLGAGNVGNMTAVVALVSFDLLTAIAAEHKAGNPIESRKALKTATKLVAYGLMISGAHLTDSILHIPEVLSRGAASFLAMTELISIVENAGKMGYAIPQKLLNQIKSLRDA